MTTLLKQSTARDVVVFMTDSSDHVTGKTGLTLTITASKNGAAFASISPTVTELSGGWYTLSLTTTHTNTLGDLALHITSTGADATDVKFQVIAFDLFSTATPTVDVSKWLGTTVATPTTAGVPEVDVTFWQGDTALETIDAPGAPYVYVGGHGTLAPPGPVVSHEPRLLKQSEGTAARRRVYFQARANATAGTLAIRAGDPINSWASVVMAGRVSKNGAAGAANAGTFAKVDSTDSPGLWYYEFAAAELDTLGIVSLYVSSTGFLTGDEARMVPLVLHVQVISPDLYDAVRLGLTSLPNAAAAAAGGLFTRGIGTGQINQSTAGTVDVVVAAMNTGTITATVIAADAIGASELAADAVAEIAAAIAVPSAATVADAVWDEATSGHVTAGSFGKALQDVSATGIRDAILDFSYRSGRTVRGLIRRLGAALETATGLKGSTVTYFQPDGVTTEFSITQNTTNGTRTNPVVTNSEVP